MCKIYKYISRCAIRQQNKLCSFFPRKRYVVDIKHRMTDVALLQASFSTKHNGSELRNLKLLGKKLTPLTVWSTDA